MAPKGSATILPRSRLNVISGKILLIAAALFAFGFGGQKDTYKRYADENDKAQLAMEGKAPPPIVSSEWLNSKPLSWKALKGKVVLLDMWAYW